MLTCGWRSGNASSVTMTYWPTKSRLCAGAPGREVGCRDPAERHGVRTRIPCRSAGSGQRGSRNPAEQSCDDEVRVLVHFTPTA